MIRFVGPLSVARVPRGFTLTELMVAVAVLLVVVLATGRIFGTVSKVTSLGTATQDVLQEAAAIERQIRRDIERLSYDGFLAIKHHSVVNNLNGPPLNPALTSGARVRSDQLVFFTQGVQSIRNASMTSSNANFAGVQSTMARVYYGHCYQVPLGQPFDLNFNRSFDVDPTGLYQDMAPWTGGTIAAVWTQVAPNVSNQSYAQTPAGDVPSVQPEARRWLLARQPILLADLESTDDMIREHTYGYSIFFGASEIGMRTMPQVRDGRVDMVSQQLSNIMSGVKIAGTSNWSSVRTRIATRAVYFPRGERLAPSKHRVDQALTSHVIGSACSSFIVEWTYAPGVGDVVNEEGEFYPGFARPSSAREQPWFGMPAFGENQPRGVDTFGQWQQDNAQNGVLYTIQPGNIESTFGFGGVDTLTTVFGYNQDQPLNESTNGGCLINGVRGVPNGCVAYTPWPTALRITMVLHDTKTKMENGREFQFVVNLPRRR